MNQDYNNMNQNPNNVNPEVNNNMGVVPNTVPIENNTVPQPMNPQPPVNPQQPMNPQQPVNPPKKSPIGAIIAIVVVVLLCIFFVVPFISGLSSANKTINRAKANSFADQALSFGNQGIILALADPDLSCNGKETKKKYFLNEMENDTFGSVSSFGGTISSSSFVMVEADNSSGNCKHKAYVYFSDGQYSIGTEDNPVLTSDITIDSIVKN